MSESVNYAALNHLYDLFAVSNDPVSFFVIYMYISYAVISP